MTTETINFPTVTEPWGHQIHAFEFIKDKPGGFLAMDMGTGKSMTAVALTLHWHCERVLILCPLSVVNVWSREFERHAPGKFKVLALNKGSVTDKKEKAESFLRVAEIRGKPCAIVINYESAWREPFKTFAINNGFNLLILDESHRIKAPGGSASRFCSQLGKAIPRRLGLTGTPMPHSPLDLYAQFRTIDPHIFGYSFSRYKQRYADMGGYHGYQVTGFKNQDEMRQKFESIAFQVTKEEALDLPELTHINIPCQISPDAMKLYLSLEINFYAEIESGEITAANVLVKGLRLQQITSGFIKNDEGVETEIDNSKAKVLEDLLVDTPQGQCVVVFCRFRNDLNKVRSIANKAGRTYGEVSGRRKDLTDTATIPNDIDVLGVQIQSGGVGIDLTRASIGIYFSLGFSLGDYLQSVSRLHRPGQNQHVTFYHLIAEKTIDERVYRALKERKNMVDEILKGGR